MLSIRLWICHPLLETYLDSSVLDVELVPPNYVVFWSDRNRHGGGLMVAVIDSLPAVWRYDLEKPDIELLWIQIFSGSTSLLFGVSYRPPSCFDYVYHLASSFHLIPSSTKVCLCGDFNIPEIDWTSSNLLSASKLEHQLY